MQAASTLSSSLRKWSAVRFADGSGSRNAAQRARVENIGVLAASGLIAGEALVGLVTATFNFFEKKLPVLFENPSYLAGMVALALLVFTLVQVPLSNAGRPEDPAPPVAMM